jgi:putative membrane protein
VVYYVGGFLLYFVPRLHLTRGGMAWMLSSLWSAHRPQTYYVAVAAVVLSGALSFFLLLLMSRLAIRLVGAVHYRWISMGTLVVLLAIVVGTTGWGGLLVCAVATGIGLIPVLWGSRRTNCMGVLLLPIGLSMVGVGSKIAGCLGLIQ